MGPRSVSLLLGLLALSAELPLARAKEHPGYCLHLPIPYDSPENAKRCNQCRTDAECPEGRKCCGSSCGNTCQAPETDRCRLPAEVGPCKAALKKFYYLWSSRRCQEFVYGGCFGNLNRFDTLELCQQACGGRSGAP